MIIQSQQDIELLIGCPKFIADPPRKEMRLEHRHKRNEMGLKSIDKQHDFHVFMRINLDFEEDFSIGLIYLPSDEAKSYILLRFNGPHGPFDGLPDKTLTHFQHHIHKGKWENLETSQRFEKGAGSTECFYGYQQALAYFLQITNVANWMDVFPDLVQTGLFDHEA